MSLISRVKKNIKKNELMMYSYRCIQNYRDKYKRNLVINKGNDYRVLKLENAEIYGGEVIYYLESGYSTTGFFAEYKRLVDALAYADLFGLKMFVWYNKDYPYSEKDTFMGTDNPFEYYFEQPSGISRKVLDSAKHFVFKEGDREYIELGLRGNNGISNYVMSESEFDIYISRASEIVRKYIHFNQITKSYLKESINKILNNKRTLGVHARGGEWRNPVKNHPIAIPLEEHIKHVKIVMDKYGFEQIFLATDEKDAIYAFRKEFGNKVVFYEDTFRGESGQWLAVTQNDRQNHRYKMGLEVLRDAETLANCQGLIAGLSNISLYAQIEKRALREKYEFINIDNKGINQSGKTGDQLMKSSN